MIILIVITTVINTVTMKSVMLAPFDWPHEEQHAGLNILFFPAVALPRCTVL
jgi:hypothetical protein